MTDISDACACTCRYALKLGRILPATDTLECLGARYKPEIVEVHDGIAPSHVVSVEGNFTHVKMDPHGMNE